MVHFQIFARSFAWLLIAAVCLTCPGAKAASPGKTRLFNGRDLNNWETLLGPARPGEPPLGRNRDPRHVFSVVQEDGAPAIRISGEIMGALVTVGDYSSYRLHAQFKWGTRRWASAQASVRDSGILYHCIEPPDPQTGGMRSFACQIQEQDCGDFYAFRGALAFAETRRMDTTPLVRQELQLWSARNPGRQTFYSYWPGGSVVRIDKDPLMKSVDAENPVGQWNTIDIYCIGDTSMHVINGVTNMAVLNLRQFDEANGLAPLTHGKIQLQSQGAEVFFRNLEVYTLGSATNLSLATPATNTTPSRAKANRSASKVRH